MLGQRLRELSQSNTTHAHELAREAVRNDNIIDVSVRDTYVVVEKENFKGTHQIQETEHGWNVNNRGQYKTLIEGVDLTFSIQAIDEKTAARIDDVLPDPSSEENDKPTHRDDEPESFPTPTIRSDPDAASESPSEATARGTEHSTVSKPTPTPTTESTTEPETLVTKVRRLIGI